MDPQSAPPSSPEPVRPQVVAEVPRGPLHVVIDEPRRMGKFWRRVFWGVLGFSLLLNFSSISQNLEGYSDSEGDLRERYHSLSKTASDKVAIISVEGTITSGEGFIKKQIDRVRHDKSVKAVVLRVDSPGGTVTGSDYIYHHLKDMLAERKIPLVVSMGSMAASGGYYVSMAAGPNAQTIYAEPTCWTGSIGVIIPHYDVSALLEKWDIQDDSIASHPLKQMGSPTARLPEKYRVEEKAILKQLVDSTFERFKGIVLESRPALKADEATQEIVFTGRIFTAGEAKQYHLVDELGFLEAAIGRAVTLAALEPDHVRAVSYHKQSSLSELLLSGGETRAPKLDLSVILDLSAPKAWYLCTMLPAAIRNH